MIHFKGFCNTDFVFDTKEDLRKWIGGARHALWTFGWWKDGVVQVGTTGMTNEEAVAYLFEQYKIATGEDFEES